MVNIPIIPPASELQVELLPDISKTWKTGQVLNATVERGGENLDKILLRIGQYVLESRNQLPLKTGEQIKVMVKSLGETPLLSILTETSTAQRAASQLRHFIAQQQDWRPLLELANKLTSTQLTPTNIKEPLQRLLDSLPTPEQLSEPQILKKFVEASGTMLESHLFNRNTYNLESDFKAQLQRLQALLPATSALSPGSSSQTEQAISLIEAWLRNPQGSPRQVANQLTTLLSPSDIQHIVHAIELRKIDTPLGTAVLQLFVHVQKNQGTATLENLVKFLTDQSALNELKTAVNQAISHISQQQLLPLVREADSAMLILFGLPLRHNEQLHWVDFRIEHDKSNRTEATSGWNVTLNFDIKELGPMQAKLHLIDKQLSTLFRANKPETVNKIRQFLPKLRQVLEKTGLTVTLLDVTEGILPPPLPINNNLRILDEQA